MNNVFKNFLCCLLFLIAGSACVYAFSDLDERTSESISTLDIETRPTDVPDDSGEEKDYDFLSEAKRLKIPARSVSGLSNVYNGYYIIAGVFGEKKNASGFSEKLAKKSLGPNILYNPKNKLHYVYLEYQPNGRAAINSCKNQLQGKYSEKLWILHVENSKSRLQKKNEVQKEFTSHIRHYEDFKKIAKKYGVSSRNIASLPGVEKGYYLVAGVFGEKTNAIKQINRLNRRSLSANILFNSNNGMYYVYLNKESDGNRAIDECRSGLNGAYADKLWILSVSNSPVNKKPEVQRVKESKKVEENKRDIYKKLVEKYEIPMRSDPGFGDLNDGFYLIAGVFGDADNASSYLQKIVRKHKDAQLATQTSSGLNYLYLKYFEDGNSAVSSYLTKLDGTFKDAMWILHVESPKKVLENKDLNEPISQDEKLTTSADGVGGKPSYFIAKGRYKSPVVNDKLLEKADSYFDKMWYAEAAELYEQILNENPQNQSFDIIRKAGDAHYFNTNMERAYHWYDILYSQYKSEMKADNLFKYAHALKGTGKYGRAKRLMRLYNKALKEESSERRYIARRNESELDNILSTELEYDIKNIGINSEYSDFSPMFYQDNKVVYASAKDSAFFNTRRYKWNDQPYLDLYVAKINEESDEVRNAVKFSKKINTKYHEAAVTFSPDQQTIYFTRNNYGKKLKRDKKGINNLKIYMSRKIGDSWTEAQELPFNSDDYSTGHPALSPDGSKLYFVSDMPGSIGKTDLFVVDVLSDGQYSEPRNLGPEINTERREMFPYFSGEKLYFASDGHIGLGGLDIYEVAVTDDGFGDVTNMGKPINSKRDDFSYIVKEDTQKGFFASNRRGGKGDDDIYSFRRILPEEPNENAIAGVVTELISGEVMPKSLVILLDENNMKLKEMETAEDGSFVFEELESNTRYVIRTEKDSYFQDEQQLTTLDNERLEIEVQMKRLEELIVLEDGISKLKIDMIYFDFDKFNIRSDAASELDKLVEVMNTYPTMVIKIESHTDSRGKRAYNKYLSDKRAKSTRDYLIGKGIDPKRIQSAIGYGEERLLNECNGTVRCSSAKHQLNRRSEFIIVNM